MTRVCLSSIGILGPGLNGWEQARDILQGHCPYLSEQVQIPPPEILPPRDRRRCSSIVSLALHVARETVRVIDLDAKIVPSVFAYSSGDGQVVHRLLSALAKPAKPVSPTDFHNSVHNAPAFYWSLGTGCREPSTSIAAGRYSFAAALLRSAVESSTRGTAMLMVCFDHPLPDPLGATYSIVAPLGIGMVVTPGRTSEGMAELDLEWAPEADMLAAVEPPQIASLVDLWSGNPAGRALPLIEAIANRRSTTVAVPGAHDAVLKIGVTCR